METKTYAYPPGFMQLIFQQISHYGAHGVVDTRMLFSHGEKCPLCQKQFEHIGNVVVNPGVLAVWSIENIDPKKYVLYALCHQCLDKVSPKMNPVRLKLNAEKCQKYIATTLPDLSA